MARVVVLMDGVLLRKGDGVDDGLDGEKMACGTAEGASTWRNSGCVQAFGGRGVIASRATQRDRVVSATLAQLRPAQTTTSS